MRYLAPALSTVFLTLLLVGSLGAQEPRKWAIVVGVDDYIHFGDEPGGDLRGAERDARSFHEVLVERWGFQEENTRLLLSRQATKAAIHEAITGWAAQRVGPDDILIFYFAGHGAQAFDEDGDEVDDALDETIAPADAAATHSDQDIQDDELRDWLDQVGAGELVVILDSCHSGSATRSTGPMRARVLARDPPRGNVSTRALTQGGATRGADQSMADGETRILEIAAAAPHQSAMEGVFQNSGSTTTFPAGAFTFYLVRQLWQAPPEASYQALFRRVVSDLKAGHFSQDPQLSGELDAPIFLGRSLPGSSAPVHEVAVDESASVPAAEEQSVEEQSVEEPEERPEEEVTAVANAAEGSGAAGAAAAEATAVEGPTAVSGGGSEPPAPSDPAGLKVLQAGAGSAVLSGGTTRSITVGSLYGTESGSVLRIADVRADEATADVVQGTPRIGETAALLEVALPTPGLTVSLGYLNPELSTAVSAGVAEERDIQVTDDLEAPADIFLRPSEDERAIQILGRDGGLRGTTLATTPTPETAQRLVAALRKELAIKRLATLENPGAAFGVDVEVGGGKRVFQEGDTISFRVRTERSGYLTLIDLGMDGTITVLHPNGFEDFGRLEAGQEVRIPGEWAVFTIGEETGLGMVRAIVTPEPLEIQGASRGLVQNPDGAGLAEEIRSLLRNQNRNIVVHQRAEGEAPAFQSEPPARRWATSMVVYEVRGN